MEDETAFVLFLHDIQLSLLLRDSSSRFLHVVPVRVCLGLFFLLFLLSLAQMLGISLPLPVPENGQQILSTQGETHQMRQTMAVFFLLSSSPEGLDP